MGTLRRLRSELLLQGRPENNFCKLLLSCRKTRRIERAKRIKLLIVTTCLLTAFPLSSQNDCERQIASNMHTMLG